MFLKKRIIIRICDPPLKKFGWVVGSTLFRKHREKVVINDDGGRERHVGGRQRQRVTNGNV